MRYIIIGAGAVGGTIGGRLFESGHEVVLVARGAHLAALRERGLTLRTPDGTRTLRVPTAAGPEEAAPRPGDVLVLAVKLQHAVDALDAWAPYAREAGGLPLLCAQNGVAGERLALRRFSRVYGVCVWLPSEHLRPGEITAPCAPLTGMLHLGPYPERPARSDGSDRLDPADEAVLRPIAADLEASHFMAPVVPDVMRWKYAKLLLNLANAVEAVTGPNPELVRRARAEGEAVLAAAGIAHTGEAEQAALRGRRMEIQPLGELGTGAGGGSSWQSLRRGSGSIEADYLNGEIVLLGRRHGVPTPVNEALQHAANDFARQGREPSSLAPEEFAALIPTP
ncbi:ketopantoate reductase family protein [Streptomyces sp. 4N509B]|uniref:ketopantoate reductase family protein n=1 Tax=Streptomyces sp. 4N509B TaxID=3457413 RepID=UPI003FD28BB1